VLPTPRPNAATGIPVTFAGAAFAALRLPISTLVNADPAPASDDVIERCRRFAEANAGGLIVTLLPAAPAGLEHFAQHKAAAILWAFTRQAALAWAPRKIRINAISLGGAPSGADEASDQAGRAAAQVRAVPATQDDLISTLRLIAELPSMTGQLIRLGA
jgi:NAD(P)-dependent dehydrogenase (short-subunit alcohol dehydrogenase family)